jgi:hypothetical protein
LAHAVAASMEVPDPAVAEAEKKKLVRAFAARCKCEQSGEGARAWQAYQAAGPAEKERILAAFREAEKGLSWAKQP